MPNTIIQAINNELNTLNIPTQVDENSIHIQLNHECSITITVTDEKIFSILIPRTLPQRQKQREDNYHREAAYEPIGHLEKHLLTDPTSIEKTMNWLKHELTFFAGKIHLEHYLTYLNNLSKQIPIVKLGPPPYAK